MQPLSLFADVCGAPITVSSGFWPPLTPPPTPPKPHTSRMTSFLLFEYFQLTLPQDFCTCSVFPVRDTSPRSQHSGSFIPLRAWSSYYLPRHSSLMPKSIISPINFCHLVFFNFLHETDYMSLSYSCLWLPVLSLCPTES